MIRFGVLACCLALSACTAGTGLPGGNDPGAMPPFPDPAADSCTAGPFGGLVGQDATSLERVLIMRPVRVIRPGMAVTMDYRPDRINFDIGPDNRIRRIYCG